MPDSLFRPEALEAKRRSRLGDTSVAQPLPAWLLTAFAVTAAAGVVALLACGEYTRRSRVSGQLVPDGGLVTIVAPADGILARPLPAEGAQVGRGRVLVVITTSRVTASSGDTTAELLSRLEDRRAASHERFATEERLLETRVRGIREQWAAARRELGEIESSLALERERLRISEELQAGLHALADRQHVSRLQLAQQEQATLERAAALHALQRQATSLQRELLGMEQRLREITLQQSVQQAAHAAELAELDQERVRTEAAGEVLVKAPLDGLVASAIAGVGQAVRSGQPLLSLVPQGSVLRAQLLVPSRGVGFIDAGDTVLLRYQAFPHEKFGHHRGTVVSVSRNALDPAAVAALTGSAPYTEPLYRVLVELAEQSVGAFGERAALRPGMLVEADILGERRKLYEWLLEPLYTLTGRL